MLTHIHIKNFAIIDEINLDFYSGLTVITGETGAGKSIIIDALELALGARADNNCIRQNCQRCEITAIFDVKNLTTTREWLEEQALDSNAECVIRRVISADGRSRTSINGSPCTQQVVRELSGLLVNIHGQHEHQSLLKREQQLKLIDVYAKHDGLCERVKFAYQKWREANDELKILENKTENNNARLDLLRYQVNELNKLALEGGEIEKLHKEYRRLNNADQMLNSCNLATELIAGDHESAILNTLHATINYLEGIKALETRIANAATLLNNAIIHVEEANAELQYYLNHTSINPKQLAQIETRLNTIHDIARKHHTKAEDLLELQQKLGKELGELENADVRIETLRKQVSILAEKYFKIAYELSDSRRKAATTISNDVTNNMQVLGMPGGIFNIVLEQDKTLLSPHGLEKATFLVSINPGQALQPLNKVVSGGELSRISLAIHVITAKQDITPTLIFDEVDVGIGGKTAEIVGCLLKTLGASAQILCITHLPQIAAQGQQHLQVDKQSDGQMTQAKITTLTEKQRVEELARMLGGITITKQTLAHAEEMLTSH